MTGRNYCGWAAPGISTCDRPPGAEPSDSASPNCLDENKRAKSYEQKATHHRKSGSALDGRGAFPGLGAGESNIFRVECSALGASDNQAHNRRAEDEGRQAPLTRKG